MPSEAVRELVGRKRTLEILALLADAGTQNYSEIEAAIDSSSATISEGLKILQKHGLVRREEESAKDVQYLITAQGEECLELVSQLESLLAEDSD